MELTFEPNHEKNITGTIQAKKKMAHDWNGYISLLDAARMNDHCRIYCDNHLCDHSGRLDFRPLIDRYGLHIGLGQILRRMRCEKCGSLGARPIAEPGNKVTPANPLYCAIKTDQPHPCDPHGSCKDGCRL